PREPARDPRARGTADGDGRCPGGQRAPGPALASGREARCDRPGDRERLHHRPACRGRAVERHGRLRLGGRPPGRARQRLERPLPAAPDPATWLDIPSPAPGGTPRAIVLSDSTASEYPPEHAPREGWGMQLGAASGLEVLNRAVSGRSSASFLAEGHLDRALEELRPGDLVLIAFGHNDPKDDERFADVHLAYPAALRRMLVGARARGGIPVLLTSIERRRFEDGHAVP